MLTSGTYKYFGFLVKMASFFVSCPFKWDKGAGKIAVARSRIYSCILVANMLRCCVYDFYMAQVILNGILSGDRSVTKLVIDGFALTTYTPLFMFQLSTWINSAEFVEYFKSVFQLDQLFTAKYPAEKLGRPSDGVDFVIAMMNTVVIPQAMIITFLWVESPQDPRYWFYLIGGEKTWWIYVLWYFLEVYFIIVPCLNLFFLWHGMNMYGGVTSFWIKRLSQRIKNQKRLGDRASGGRISSEIMESIRAYKYLFILGQRFNYCYRKMAWSAMNLYALTNQVLITFVVVRLHGKIPTQIFVLFPFYLFLFLVFEFLTYPTVGGVYDNSSEFKYTLACTGNPLCRRYARSLATIGVQVGHLYVVRKPTVLTFLQLIVNVTVSILVSVG